MVPTVDTFRNQLIIKHLLDFKVPTLIVGATGTGKTSVIEKVLEDHFNDNKKMNFTINFSTFTSSPNV